MQALDEQQLRAWEQRFIDYLEKHATNDDGSHDLGHFRRVWRTAQELCLEEHEPVNPLILLAAAYFHDLISLPKNHPDAHLSSLLSARQTASVLQTHFPDFPQEAIADVAHAIHAHSFSAKVTPVTVAAKILQDADRMEALGAIGIARTFYTGGRLGTQMFSSDDPMATLRPLNDKMYSLDHFTVKLFKLPELMNTAAGVRMATQRVDFLRTFLEQIAGEILG